MSCAGFLSVRDIPGDWKPRWLQRCFFSALKGRGFSNLQQA